MLDTLYGMRNVISLIPAQISFSSTLGKAKTEKFVTSLTEKVIIEYYFITHLCQIQINKLEKIQNIKSLS